MNAKLLSMHTLVYLHLIQLIWCTKELRLVRPRTSSVLTVGSLETSKYIRYRRLEEFDKTCCFPFYLEQGHRQQPH